MYLLFCHLNLIKILFYLKYACTFSRINNTFWVMFEGWYFLSAMTSRHFYVCLKCSNIFGATVAIHVKHNWPTHTIYIIIFVVIIFLNKPTHTPVAKRYLCRMPEPEAQVTGRVGPSNMVMSKISSSTTSPLSSSFPPFDSTTNAQTLRKQNTKIENCWY